MADMRNLPKRLVQRLEENFDLFEMVPADIQHSNDGTVKCAFRLYDGNIVEGVLIPQEKRMTACVSSQVGCSLSCSFCATGRLARVRNLYFDEIYDQVVWIHRQALEKFGQPLTNIVFMGMGEPLLNYSQVSRAIERITAPDGLNMSPRRITLSTAGVAKMIERMAEEGVKFNLAVSLHAATEEKRSTIMPINDTNSLEALSTALKKFTAATGTRVTLEYTLLKDFNDSREDADALTRFSRQFPCKVNLIEYNPIDGGTYERAAGNAMHRFKQRLEEDRVEANIRRSRGKDIDAACGQLANKNKAVAV